MSVLLHAPATARLQGRHPLSPPSATSPPYKELADLLASLKASGTCSGNHQSQSQSSKLLAEGFGLGTATCKEPPQILLGV